MGPANGHDGGRGRKPTFRTSSSRDPVRSNAEGATDDATWVDQGELRRLLRKANLTSPVQGKDLVIIAAANHIRRTWSSRAQGSRPKRATAHRLVADWSSVPANQLPDEVLEERARGSEARSRRNATSEEVGHRRVSGKPGHKMDLAPVADDSRGAIAVATESSPCARRAVDPRWTLITRTSSERLAARRPPVPTLTGACRSGTVPTHAPMRVTDGAPTEKDERTTCRAVDPEVIENMVDQQTIANRWAQPRPEIQRPRERGGNRSVVDVAADAKGSVGRNYRTSPEMRKWLRDWIAQRTVSQPMR